MVSARFGSGDTEKYKCQVALLETDRFCPVKKGGTLSHTYTITPTLMHNEVRLPQVTTGCALVLALINLCAPTAQLSPDCQMYHTAQRGRVSSSDTPQLAPSTRPDETAGDRRCAAGRVGRYRLSAR